MNPCTTVKSTGKGPLKQDARGPTEPRRDPGERDQPMELTLIIQMPRSGDCERPAVPSFGRERAADGSALFDEPLHAPSPIQGLKKSADGSKANKICITGSTKRTPISWLNHPVPDF